jgi:hypothetical protein
MARIHARLLRDGQADPPASLAGAVMDRILRNGTLRPRKTVWRTIMKRRYATIAVAAGTCVAGAIIALVFANRLFENKSSDAVSQPLATPPVVTAVPPASGRSAALDRAPTDERPLIDRLTISIQEMAAEAEVIVVATVLDSAPVQPKQPGGVAEVAICWRVTRILKGELADEIITVQIPSPPVGPDVKELARREWILFLSPEFLAGKYPYAGCLSIKEEPQVRAILSGE